MSRGTVKAPSGVAVDATAIPQIRAKSVRLKGAEVNTGICESRWYAGGGFPATDWLTKIGGRDDPHGLVRTDERPGLLVAVADCKALRVSM